MYDPVLTHEIVALSHVCFCPGCLGNRGSLGKAADRSIKTLCNSCIIHAEESLHIVQSDPGNVRTERRHYQGSNVVPLH